MFNSSSLGLSQYSQLDHKVGGITGNINALEKNRQMAPDRIQQVAQEFESVFLSQMLQLTFGESIGKEAFGSKESSEIYKSMLMEEYGEIITKAGGIGIASQIETQLLKLQEV